MVHAGKTKGAIEPLRLLRGRDKNRVDHPVCASSLKISRFRTKCATVRAYLAHFSCAKKSCWSKIRSAAPPSHSSSHPHGTRQEEQEDDRRRYPHRSQEARLRRVRRRLLLRVPHRVRLLRQGVRLLLQRQGDERAQGETTPPSRRTAREPRSDARSGRRHRGSRAGS